MDEKGKRKTIKCPGRFSELRELLYNDAFSIVFGDKTEVNAFDLSEVWDLIEGDVAAANLDRRDPYFFNREDKLRKEPPQMPLSLVPMIASPYTPDRDLVRHYSEFMGCSKALADKLEIISAEHPRRFFARFGRSSGEILLPDGKKLSPYHTAAEFGIGVISPGGYSGGGVRSDSPFMLEVYNIPERGESRGYEELAGVIGFWVQDDEMLISQLQSCRNAKYPEGVPFGVASLMVAEHAARVFGFKGIRAYSAHNHPIFREHPDSWSQLGSDFSCIWDKSLHKLGYEGCKTKNYFKDLSNGKSK